MKAALRALLLIVRLGHAGGKAALQLRRELDAYGTQPSDRLHLLTNDDVDRLADVVRRRSDGAHG